MGVLHSDQLSVRTLSPADAREITTWQYDGPWSVYDSAETTAVDYWAVVDTQDESLVGFYCTGVEARVPGLDEEPGVLDLGVGMRPDLVGAGNGPTFAAAVIRHLRTHTNATSVRAVVQSWNERSIRLSRGLGLEPVGSHECVQNDKVVTYAVLCGPMPGSD